MDLFPDVFDDSSITPMKGDDMIIYINKEAPDYKPLRILTARPVPIHYKEEAKKTLKLLLKSGVIGRVDGLTEWISPAFFVPKPNGKIRLVTDYSVINKFVSRPVHPFPCPIDIVRGLKPTSKVFIKLDAVQGYHQIPLSPDSSDLTTFLLPEGKFKYLRAPMGLNPSSDAWCERSDIAIDGLDVLKIVDDILIQEPTEKAALKTLYDVLLRCREHNITLSRTKLKMGTSVKFAGFVISDGGTKPDPDKISALTQFPAPHDITAVRGFLGLVNQLGLFVPDLAHMSEPLRLLLKKNVVFDWREEHQAAFVKIKAALTSDMVVGVYDPEKPSELLTDASRLFGLGYALIQRGLNDRIILIQCGSRSLISAETRYATIELECLAILWAALHCKHYILGSRFSVITDHKPLLGIFAKPLSDIMNNRLLRFREKLVDFMFDIKWVPGKTHLIADALSRAPAFQPAEDDTAVALTLSVCPRSASPIDPALQRMIDGAIVDRNYQDIIQAIMNDVACDNLPPGHPGRLYKSIWGALSIYESCLLIYDGVRIVVPSALRPSILKNLHIAHAGLSRTKKLAQQTYYWPTINIDIKNMIDCCEPCQLLRPSQAPESLQLYPPAAEPMSDVSVDLFQVDSGKYLVMVDRYSGFPFVIKLHGLDTTSITKHLSAWFYDWGFPRYLTSDGGPQFRDEFVQYCNDNFISHTLSSAYHPQSNGLAESGVKSLKYLLIKLTSSTELPMALLHWRNVPKTIGELSPAELFLGRRQRRHMPVLPPPTPTFLPSINNDPTRILPPLVMGEKVRMQNPISKRWDSWGIIQSIRHSGRSYYVRNHEQKLMLRNRIYLKPYIVLNDANIDITSETTSVRPPIADVNADTNIPSLNTPLRRSTRIRERVRICERE